MYMYDGQSYRTKEDVPDLDSWVCTGNDGNKRSQCMKQEGF